MQRRPQFPGRVLLMFVPLVVALSLALAGCSTGGSDDDDADDMTSAAGQEESAADSGGARAGDAYSVSDTMAEQPESEPPAGQIALDRLVIRTASLTLTVEDTQNAATSIRNMAVTKGGFVFSSSTYTEDERHYAEVTLRVPSDRFDETIAELSTAPYVIDVPREETSSQDVSSEYVDNASRLTALEETQRRYLALLSDAETVDEILRLESELTEVRSQIETIKGRQNYLDEMTSFSTITVTVQPPDGQRSDPDDDTTIAQILDSAWDRSTGALAGAAEAVVVVSIFAAFFVPLVILVYAAYRLARRLTTRLTP